MIALSLVQCTSDFEKINTNPEGISDESLTQMNNHIGGSFTPMFLYVMNVTSGYQTQQNLIGDVYSGYMSSPTPFLGNVNNMTYSLVDGWNGEPWSKAYEEVMPFALDIKNTVTNTGDATAFIFIHLANIIKVTAMHRVSDIYGPIRYSKYDDIDTTGEYDSQEVAYTAFFTDLGEAIDALEEFKSDVRFTDFDMSSLEGDISLWRAFANSLRLRLALRIVKINPTLAKTQGELALASNAGFLETDMFINSGFPHPLTYISGTWGDIRMGAEMESVLTGYNDGRLEHYFNPAEDTSLGSFYKGIRMGIAIVSKTEYVAHSSIGSVVDGETMQWMSAAEVDFLQAESALRAWTGAGSAATHYTNGVTTSFTQHGVADVASYLADDTSTPANFVDALNKANNIAYASDVKIAYNASGTNEEQLEQIITQKWIAMFPDGQEAWSEFRRTGYPRIFPVIVNNSGGKIDTDIQIRRINFVVSERNTNAANVNIAIGYLGGDDTGGTRLWWDIAGGNF